VLQAIVFQNIKKTPEFQEYGKLNRRLVSLLATKLKQAFQKASYAFLGQQF